MPYGSRGDSPRLRWSTEAADEAKWYEIREATRNELMTWPAPSDEKDQVRLWQREYSKRHQFCFVPDGSGSYRIASRENYERAWFMKRESDINPSYYAVMTDVEHPKYNAFYLEYVKVGTKKRMRIVEPTGEEYITVSWGAAW